MLQTRRSQTQRKVIEAFNPFASGLKSLASCRWTNRREWSMFPTALKPNSITLASSELAPNMFGAELASFMEFGFYGYEYMLFWPNWNYYAASQYYVRRCGLFCYRLSSVVCLSVCLSQSWALKKRLNRSRCCFGWGLGWAQGTMYYMGVQIIPWEGAILTGRPTVKYRDTLRWAVQKQLNQSWCRLGCGLGCAKGFMYWIGVQNSP